MPAQLITTKDGSHTLFVPELNEHYHSTFGAIQESRHVFIENGIKQINKKHIKVFEVGFGTGLNALLTFNYAIKNNVIIEYHSIEKYPVETEVTNQLNYVDLVDSSLTDVFNIIHSSSWNKLAKIHKNIGFCKYEADIKDFKFNSKYDIIYFDAFAFEKQPGMWSFKIFEKIYKACHSKAILVTYASKGIIKQNLREAGFTVKRLKGPEGKRHMLMAVK